MGSDVKLSHAWRRWAQTFRELHITLHHSQHSSPWLSAANMLISVQHNAAVSQGRKSGKNWAENESSNSHLFLYSGEYIAAVYWKVKPTATVMKCKSFGKLSGIVFAPTSRMRHCIKQDQPRLWSSHFTYLHCLHTQVYTLTNTKTQRRTLLNSPAVEFGVVADTVEMWC